MADVSRAKTSNEKNCFVIEGGRELSGVITTNTAKNSAVSLLMASLINRNSTILRNVPRIEEVFRLIEVMRSLGVQVSWKQRDLYISPPAELQLTNIDRQAALKTRSSMLLMGALSWRNGHYTIPFPGGCKLGERTLSPHLLAFSELGIGVHVEKGQLVICGEHRHVADLIMNEASDVAVENVLLAAATIDGTTVIRKASANYQVQETCLFLQKLGVQVDGIGTSTLTVKGCAEINLPVEYHLAEDPIESMFFISTAIVTRSSIIIKRCPIDFLELELYKLRQMGFKFNLSSRYYASNGHTVLVDITTFPSTLRSLKDKLHALPYPGINADNLPFFAPIAAASSGKTLIHDWMYEGRANYYLLLKKMGANVVLEDQHRAFIDGPTELFACDLVAPPALRPAAIVLIAMLAAKGRSVLRNHYPILRGYENLGSRLNGLGANIWEI